MLGNTSALRLRSSERIATLHYYHIIFQGSHHNLTIPQPSSPLLCVTCPQLEQHPSTPISIPIHQLHQKASDMTDGLGALGGMPTELRARIYAKMSPPLTGPIQDFKGIVLANRNLKTEVEDELIRNMKHFLEGIMEEWSKTYHSPLRIEIPTSIADIQKVRITIPRSIFRWPGPTYVKASVSPLLPLLDLHVSSIRITFYADEEIRASPLQTLAFLRRKASYNFKVALVSFLQAVTLSFNEDTHILYQNGTQYAWKDNYNIKTITIEWEPNVIMQECMALAIRLSREHGCEKVGRIGPDGNSVVWQNS
jgi:hypothetical protein